MSTPPTSPPGGEPTNPLGGRIHSINIMRKPRNTWPGFATMVRVCPVCGNENAADNVFCEACAADIQGVQPSPSERGVTDEMSRRQRHEERVDLTRRRRPNLELSGGFVAIGALFVIFAVFMETAPVIRIPVWLAGVALGIAGIWQIRANGMALRRWGIALSTCAIATIVGLALETRQLPGSALPALPNSTSEADQVAHVGSPVVAASGSTVAGSIPMAGVSATHDNVVDASAPQSEPAVSWRTDAGAESYGSPILENGILYLVTKDGVLHAIDAGTGATMWTHSMTNYALRAAPAVSDGLVLTGAGFEFVALDAKTGQKRWSTPVPYVGHASPTVADGVIYVPSQQGWMFALSVKDGKVLWQTPTEGVVFGAVAISGDGVLYGTDTGVLYNVRNTNGQVRWRKRFDGPIYASPAVLGTSVYVTTEAGTTQGLDSSTGDQLWTFEHGSSDALAVREGLLVIASSDGGIYGLDPATGTQKWLYPSGKRTLTGPIIAQNQVLIGADASVVALDAETGTARWYVLAGDTVVSPAIVADGRVFFSSQDGFVNALAARN